MLSKLKFSLIIIFIILLSLPALTQEKKEASIEADKVYLEEDGWIVAEGNVKLTYEGTIIEADQVELQKEERIVKAFGHVYITQEGEKNYGEMITYNLRTKEGMLYRVEGQTKNFQLKGESVAGNEYLFYRGEEVDVDPKKLILDTGEFTTCDLGQEEEHYHLLAENTEVLPDDKLVARNVYVYYKDKKIFWVPIVIVSLKEKQVGRQNFLPQMGYNQTEGFFVKHNFNYYFNYSNYGSIRVDYASNLGVSLGIENYYKIGESGQGYFSYLRQNGTNDIVNNSFSYRHTQNITKALTMNFDFGLTKNTGLTFVQNPNINSKLLFNYTGNKFNTNFTTSYFKSSSLSKNLNFSLNHRQSFGKLQTNLQLNSTNSTAPATDDRNQLKFLFTGTMPAGPVNLDLKVDYSHANFSQSFLQKIPELAISQVKPFTFGGATLRSVFSMGYFDEQSSDTQTFRGNMNLALNKNFNIASGNTLRITSTLDQSFYGTGEARYMWNNQFSLANAFGSHFKSQFDFTSRLPKGFSPLRFDGIGQKYNAFTYRMEIFDKNIWKVNISTGYNITSNNYNPLVARIDLKPKNNIIFNFGFAYDLNNKKAQTFDTKMDLILFKDWRFEYASSYNFLSSKFGNQDFKLTKDNHCWLWSLGYRTYKNELLFQVAVKAFPHQSFEVGTSAEGPILPLIQDIQSPNFQF